MGTIEWLPIADLPEALKNGRELLPWSGGAEVGKWCERKGEGWDHSFWDSGFASEVDGGPIEIISPTHFAEINPPA